MEHTLIADKKDIERMEMDENINIKRAQRRILNLKTSSYLVTFEVECRG